MTAAELRDRAPQGDPLTDYDRAQATVYLRLLDADADPDGDTFDTISEDELLRGIESLAPPERRDD